MRILNAAGVSAALVAVAAALTGCTPTTAIELTYTDPSGASTTFTENVPTGLEDYQLRANSWVSIQAEDGDVLVLGVTLFRYAYGPPAFPDELCIRPTGDAEDSDCLGLSPVQETPQGGEAEVVITDYAFTTGRAPFRIHGTIEATFDSGATVSGTFSGQPNCTSPPYRDNQGNPDVGCGFRRPDEDWSEVPYDDSRTVLTAACPAAIQEAYLPATGVSYDVAAHEATVGDLTMPCVSTSDGIGFEKVHCRARETVESDGCAWDVVTVLDSGTATTPIYQVMARTEDEACAAEPACAMQF